MLKKLRQAESAFPEAMLIFIKGIYFLQMFNYPFSDYPFSNFYYVGCLGHSPLQLPSWIGVTVPSFRAVGTIPDESDLAANSCRGSASSSLQVFKNLALRPSSPASESGLISFMADII